MARMTKTQIDCIRTKLQRKVTELTEKFRNSINDGDTYERLVSDASLKRFVVWCKENASKAELIDAINSDGYICIKGISKSTYGPDESGRRGYTTHRKIVSIDKITDAMQESVASYKFLRSIKALTRCEKLEKIEVFTAKEELKYKAEAETILDKLSELIEKFLKK